MGLCGSCIKLSSIQSGGRLHSAEGNMTYTTHILPTSPLYGVFTVIAPSQLLKTNMNLFYNNVITNCCSKKHNTLLEDLRNIT